MQRNVAKPVHSYNSGFYPPGLSIHTPLEWASVLTIYRCLHLSKPQDTATSAMQRPIPRIRILPGSARHRPTDERNEFEERADRGTPDHATSSYSLGVFRARAKRDGGERDTTHPHPHACRNGGQRAGSRGQPRTRSNHHESQTGETRPGVYRRAARRGAAVSRGFRAQCTQAPIKSHG